MKNWIVAARVLFILTVVTGVAYPLLVTGLAQGLFADGAAGSLVRNHAGQVVGSALLAQKFEGAQYFWPRPSAVGFNPLPSGGSNQSPISTDLKKAVEERRAFWKKTSGTDAEPPADLLFASGSGLDPHITPEAARYQMGRVADARKMDRVQLETLVARFTEKRQYGVLGEPRVNVLRLNLALDEEKPAP